MKEPRYLKITEVTENNVFINAIFNKKLKNPQNTTEKRVSNKPLQGQILGLYLLKNFAIVEAKNQNVNILKIIFSPKSMTLCNF